MVRIQQTSGVKPKKQKNLPYRPKGGKAPSWKDEGRIQYQARYGPDKETKNES